MCSHSHGVFKSVIDLSSHHLSLSVICPRDINNCIYTLASVGIAGHTGHILFTAVLTQHIPLQ